MGNRVWVEWDLDLQHHYLCCGSDTASVRTPVAPAFAATIRTALAEKDAENARLAALVDEARGVLNLVAVVVPPEGAPHLVAKAKALLAKLSPAAPGERET